jgi:hypothetical protein
MDAKEFLPLFHQEYASGICVRNGVFKYKNLIIPSPININNKLLIRTKL